MTVLNKDPVYINPIKDLGSLLLEVDKPSRYTGGEAGRLADKENIFKTVIAFADLYEIGMGNQALRIIYNGMNSLKDVSCDRAFAPAPDFEKLLRDNNMPLYGLDTGISLFCADLLMFTIGYELGLNGILTMLDVSAIPIHSVQRKEEHPLVIAGGPAISNPIPFSPFIDAFWIGEAEAGFFELIKEMAALKKAGKGRAELFEIMASHKNIWVKGKQKAVRAIAKSFSQDAAVFPVPSMKIIQNHGAVEIMRGCPNGCRFCHAGFWYRPQRQKAHELIVSQVKEMVNKGGWQEISLSSLSSGDYSGIEDLVEDLNNQFSGSHISFQLPSLKVSGFSLSLLEKISVTRKSGLTFAVETPKDAWQMSINKEVTRDSVIAIIHEAKKRGWKQAKFYFMLGLPVNMETENMPSMENQDGAIGFMGSEEQEIVSFVADIGRASRMHFNINIGIFIPKPHTPYQWASQMDSETAENKLSYIRSKLKPLGHKVSISDTLISRIEGLLSRGDERAGMLCEEAWRFGSRLDPWSEFINREKWLEIFKENQDYTDSVFSGKNENLPWNVIDPCVTEDYLKKELEKSCKSQPSSKCGSQCALCGVCNSSISVKKEVSIFKKILVNQNKKQVNETEKIKTSDPAIYRVLFSFSKEGSAVFHGHLSLIEVFSMSFRRAGIPVLYTQGFNPLAKMEFASPLSTGITAHSECASVDFSSPADVDIFLNSLNSNLPQGVVIKKAQCFLIKTGMKKYSLSSLLWGFSYLNKDGLDYVPEKEEKAYRIKRLEDGCESLFDLRRNEVLAKNIINETPQWSSYFDIYNHLYG